MPTRAGADDKAFCELRLGGLSCFCHCAGQQARTSRDAELDLSGSTSGGTEVELGRHSGAAENSPHEAMEVHGIEATTSTPGKVQAVDCLSTGRGSEPTGDDDEAQQGDVACSDDAGDEACRAALCEALRHGCVLEAQRELVRLKAPERVDPSHVEQIRRIAACYMDSMQDLLADPGYGWTSEQVEGLKYSYLLSDGQFKLVSTIESTVDPGKALAAILEMDLSMGYKPNISSAVSLGGKDFEPYDAVWHIVQKGRITGAPEDNISQVSVVDALDEAAGSLWACIYPPENPNASELRGMRLPVPEHGASREAGWRTTFQITPVHDYGGPGVLGFRMASALSVRLSRTAQMFLSRMPSWSLRMILSRCARELLDSFAKHMDCCEELQRRLASSPRAPFYAHIRRRLAGEPLPRAPALPLANTGLLAASSSGAIADEDAGDSVDSSKAAGHFGEVTPGTSMAAGSNTDSSLLSEDSEEAPGHAGSLGAARMLTWEELSQHIPLDWASYQE